MRLMKKIKYRGCLMGDKNICWFYSELSSDLEAIKFYELYFGVNQEDLVIEYYDEYFNIWQLII